MYNRREGKEMTSQEGGKGWMEREWKRRKEKGRKEKRREEKKKRKGRQQGSLKKVSKRIGGRQKKRG